MYVSYYAAMRILPVAVRPIITTCSPAEKRRELPSELCAALVRDEHADFTLVPPPSPRELESSRPWLQAAPPRPGVVQCAHTRTKGRTGSCVRLAAPEGPLDLSDPAFCVWGGSQLHGLHCWSASAHGVCTDWVSLSN